MAPKFALAVGVISSSYLDVLGSSNLGDLFFFGLVFSNVATVGILLFFVSA